MEKYQRIRVLNRGAFGVAVLHKEVRTGKQYVIKEIDISKMSRKEREDTQKEVAILSAMKHPNIVEYHESFNHAGKLCIAMAFADGGDLFGKIKAQAGRYFSEEKVLDWFVQICLSMKHVHDRKILHRDLKSQNIFLTGSGKIVKLGDFGIAKVLKNTMECARTAIGTPYYLSPEICQGKLYNFKSDIWSLGCVLYELCTLRCPFDAANMKGLILKILKGHYPPIPGHFSPELKQLVSSMLTKDPKARPSVNAILRMPIMRERIRRFLDETSFEHEFSHTVLHGQHGLKAVVRQKAADAAAGHPAGPREVWKDHAADIPNAAERERQRAEAREKRLADAKRREEQVREALAKEAEVRLKVEADKQAKLKQQELERARLREVERRRRAEAEVHRLKEAEERRIRREKELAAMKEERARREEKDRERERKQRDDALKAFRDEQQRRWLGGGMPAQAPVAGNGAAVQKQAPDAGGIDSKAARGVWSRDPGAGAGAVRPSSRAEQIKSQANARRQREQEEKEAELLAARKAAFADRQQAQARMDALRHGHADATPSDHQSNQGLQRPNVDHGDRRNARAQSQAEREENYRKQLEQARIQAFQERKAAKERLDADRMQMHGAHPIDAYNQAKHQPRPAQVVREPDMQNPLDAPVQQAGPQVPAAERQMEARQRAKQLEDEKLAALEAARIEAFRERRAAMARLAKEKAQGDVAIHPPSPTAQQKLQEPPFSVQNQQGQEEARNYLPVQLPDPDDGSHAMEENVLTKPEQQRAAGGGSGSDGSLGDTAVRLEPQPTCLQDGHNGEMAQGNHEVSSEEEERLDFKTMVQELQAIDEAETSTEEDSHFGDDDAEEESDREDFNEVPSAEDRDSCRVARVVESDGNVRKFVKTKAQSSADSMFQRVEELRVYLEQQLGADKFMDAYACLQGIDDDDDEEQATMKINNVLGTEHVDLFGVIVQLLECENELYQN